MNNIFPIKLTNNLLLQKENESVSLEQIIYEMQEFNDKCLAIKKLQEESSLEDYDKKHNITKKKGLLLMTQLISTIGIFSFLPSNSSLINMIMLLLLQIINAGSVYFILKLNYLTNSFHEQNEIQMKKTQIDIKTKELIQWAKNKNLEAKLIALYQQEINDTENSDFLKRNLEILVSNLITKNDENLTTKTLDNRVFSNDKDNIEYYLGLNEYLNDYNLMKAEKKQSLLHKLKYHKSFFKKESIGYMDKLKRKL